MGRSDSQPDRTRPGLFLAIALLLITGCKQLRSTDAISVDRANPFKSCDVLPRGANARQVRCSDFTFSWERDESGEDQQARLDAAPGRLGAPFDDHAQKENVEFEVDGRKHKAIRLVAEGEAGGPPPPRALIVLVTAEKRGDLFACVSHTPPPSFDERCRSSVASFLRSVPEPTLQPPDPAAFANCQVTAPRPEERQIRCLNLFAFIKEAPRAGVSDERILELWQKYLEKVNNQPLKSTEKGVSASFGGREWAGMHFTGNFLNTGDPYQGSAFVRSSGEYARVITCMASGSEIERCKSILEATAHLMPRLGSY